MKKSPRIFFKDTESTCQLITVLSPYLSMPYELNQLMQRREKTELDTTCRWIGFGIGKGVTHPMMDISVFGIKRIIGPNDDDKIMKGLHGKMMQGFKDIPVDPVHRCYKDDHELGFGGFIRWVSFFHPEKNGFLGIDYDRTERPTSGVACSMQEVYEVVRILARHGFPKDYEVVMLNGRMHEDPESTAWRKEHELVTLRDWIEKFPSLKL